MPTLSEGFSVIIRHSTPNEDVYTLSSVEDSTQTSVLVPLNCSFAGRSVTFGVQFTTPECSSNVASISTAESNFISNRQPALIFKEWTSSVPQQK